MGGETVNTSDHEDDPIVYVTNVAALSAIGQTATVAWLRALENHAGVALLDAGLLDSGITIGNLIDVACPARRPRCVLFDSSIFASRSFAISHVTAPTILDARGCGEMNRCSERLLAERVFDFACFQCPACLAIYQDRFPDAKCFWHPFAVQSTVFRDWRCEKDIDVSMYGGPTRDQNSFRWRVADLLSHHAELRFRFLLQPTNDELSARSAGERLSREISRSWLSLAECSTHVGSGSQYFEIAASGALPAGRLSPMGHPFVDDILCLDEGQSDSQIVATFIAALRDKTALASRIQRLSARVRRLHTLKWSAQRWLDFVDEQLVWLRSHDDTSKWREQRRSRWPMRTTLEQVPEEYSGLGERRPRLSLCMIVRDNEATLGAALAGIRPWVDEAIIVDTGSHDRTREIAKDFDCDVKEFTWCDDFSAARNESLKCATGDWIFWMDSDDTIDEVNARRLRRLVDAIPSCEQLAYVMQVRCPAAGRSDDFTTVDHVKLFRNRPDLRFEGRIHEQILPAVRRAGGTVGWSDIFVVHSNANQSLDGKQHKFERDLHHLQRELIDHPDHPFALFNIGMTYADRGDHERAIDALARSLLLSDPAESHVRKAYALAVGSLTELNRLSAAEDVCRRGRAVYPKDPELLFREGILAHRLGQLERAAQCYLTLLSNEDDRHFSSIDAGIRGIKTYHNLAVVYDALGRFDQSTALWRLVLRESPRCRPAMRGFSQALLQQGLTHEAADFSNRLCHDPETQTEGLVIRAAIARRAGQNDVALGLLESAAACDTDDHLALRALCQLLFDTTQDARAEEWLALLTTRQPDDASAWHNLGTVCLRQGRFQAAADAYSRSLTLRPESAATKLQLECALRNIAASLGESSPDVR